MPKVGLRLTVDKAYENLQYFGRGPEDNYIDRKTAADLGVYESTVTAQFDRKQLTAQENGNHTDVRWIALTDQDGNGLMVAADGVMESSALHVKAENLNPSTYDYPYNARERIRHSTEVPMDEQTYLCLDTMQRGVSNTGFFNHIPLEGFYPHTRPDADGNYQVYEKTVRLMPITSKTDKMAASKLGFAAEENRKDELADAIASAKEEAAKESVYTKESLETLQKEITAAEAVANKENATAKEVSDAIEALQEAMDGLEKKPVEPVDTKAELKTKLAQAREEAAKESEYTEESIKALQEAITGAETVVNKENATEQEISEAVKALQEAMGGLEKKPVETPEDRLREQLNQQLADAREESAKDTVYTKTSLNALKTAIEKADGVAKKENATEEELSQAITELKAACQKLVTQKKQALLDANKAMDQKLGQAQNLLKQTKVYTSASRKALKTAYDKAKAVRNDKEIQAAENASAIQSAMNQLQKAINGLKKLPKVNSTFQYKNAVYKVTKSAEKGGTAAFVKPLKKTYKKFEVLSTVKKDGITFKVTAIEKNAFRDNKKLQKLTIGKNVTSIGANACYNAKNLKNVVVKSTVLKKAGKNAWKGIHKNCKIKVPKSKLKAYKKIFKKKGQKSTVKIV